MNIQIVPVIPNFVLKRALLISGYFLTISICLFPSILSAQPENWNIRYFSTEDGLSSNNINCIIKDRMGMIWVGADNGLNRFDGYTFSQLKYAPGNMHTLSKIKVLSIYEDEEGLLWIGTSDGLFRFDPSKPLDQIRQFRFRDPGSINLIPQPQPVNRICEDKTGLLWMNCADADEGIYPGLVTFNKDTETFTEKMINGTILNKEGEFIKENIVPDIYCDSKGNLWVSTYSGLHRYDYGTDSFHSFVPDPKNPGSINNFILYLSEDSYGNLRASGVFGLYTFDSEKETFKGPLVLHSEGGMFERESVTFALSDDRSGNVWMRVNQSLIRSRTEPGRSNILAIDQEWIPELSNVSTINQLTALYVENPWSIWLPVADRGLCHIQLQRNKFKVLEPSALPGEDRSKANYITALYADSLHNLWFATINPGATKYNLQNNVFEDYTMTSYNYINGIDKDVEGNIWFASRYGIYTKASMDQNGYLDYTSYFPDTSQSNSLTPRHEINARGVGKVSHYLYEHLIFSDIEGRIWFNSGKGIHDRFNPEDDGFIHLDHRKVDTYNNDTCLAEMEGEIWLPSRHGLLRIIPPIKEISDHRFLPEHTILYTSIKKDEFSLNTDWIKTIHISKYHDPGTVWIATIGGGLNRLVKKRIKGSECIEVHFEHFTEADGLCDNNVLGILEDRNGNLWLSTLNGLSRFDPETESFINYYEKDGLPANAFSWAEPCSGSRGEMIFPNSRGILIFDPNNLQSNDEIPPVIITGFRIFNEPVIPGSGSPIEKGISYIDKVVLDYNQNFISFEFAALNFEAPGQNQYRYRMEGLDRDWVHAGTRRFAEYTDLQPGSYTFTVTGSNNNGLWNEEGRSLQVIIRRPPWYSWWAYTIYGMILSVLFLWTRTFLLNRARTKKALEIERIEKDKILEVDRLKSRFFANISHEFRTPLTLIISHVRDLKKQTADTINMKRASLEVLGRNANRLLVLINQLLDIAKLEKNALQIDLTKGNLSDWTRVIVSSFQSLADSKDINFHLKIEDSSKEVCFDPDKTEKILTNLLSNSFKFTDKGGSITFILNYSLNDRNGLKNVRIEVSDNGKGMAKNELSKIFDPFYQISSSDIREAEGSGIGLSLTKELVELLHGSIEVESELGRGTMFTVVLPVSEKCFPDTEIKDTFQMENGYSSTIANNNIQEEEVRKETDNNGRVILIVEDNPDLRKYLSDQLSSNYSILTAMNGKEGLRLAKKHIPELIISDLMMPEMGGMELTKMLKADTATNHIPVIILTAKADKESKLDGFETGADDYIIKPFDSDEIKSRILNLIRQREMLRNKFEKNFLFESEEKASSLQYKMLRKILKTVESHLGDPGFNLDVFSAELNMTRTQLFRKIRSITGTTPNELIRIVRMKHAAQLLRNSDLNITQVMYEIGLRNPSHFAKSFKKYFGNNPAEYKNNHSKT